MMSSKNQDIMDLFDAPNTETSDAFSGVNVSLDTSTQLVSSTVTTVATEIVDTTAKIQENPFAVAEDPQFSTDDEELGVGSSEPADKTLIAAAEVKKPWWIVEQFLFRLPTQRQTQRKQHRSPRRTISLKSSMTSPPSCPWILRQRTRTSSPSPRRRTSSRAPSRRSQCRRSLLLRSRRRPSDFSAPRRSFAFLHCRYNVRGGNGVRAISQYIRFFQSAERLQRARRQRPRNPRQS